MEITYFKQTKSVKWLKTEANTIWISTGFEDYIQPEDIGLRTTLLGVDLQLLGDDESDLFEPIVDVKIN